MCASVRVRLRHFARVCLRCLPSIEWTSELLLRLSAPRIVVSDRVCLRRFALPNTPDWHLASNFFRLVFNMA